MILRRRAGALYTLCSCAVHVVGTRLTMIHSQLSTGQRMFGHAVSVSSRAGRCASHSEPSELPSSASSACVRSIWTMAFFFFFRRLFLEGDVEPASVSGGGPSRFNRGILGCRASNDALAVEGGADGRAVTCTFEGPDGDPRADDRLACGFTGDGGTDMPSQS